MINKVDLIILLMESSEEILAKPPIFLSQSREKTREEVYQMPKTTVSAVKKKKHQHKSKRKGSTGMEINETMKLAAKGYGTTHRL